MNDTAVFDAFRIGPSTERNTRQAITRSGFLVDATSIACCPHEWLDEASYVDANLARKHPYHLAL